MAIQSFADKVTENFYYTGELAHQAGWANITKVARRKLDLLNAAIRLNDLKVPPSNRLEMLQGKMAGCHSIRINDQWRVVFEWTDLGPKKVQVIDYH